MCTYHVALRLMVFFNFSGGGFSDDDLLDVGNDKTYNPDKGKGKVLSENSHYLGWFEVNVK